uniref:Protein-S-isoprenylcysteine O-methyltransferase n=1 Tax=Palpitomonas bilix TaxID=652834 RepID=A0A7S3G6R1_9EUKA|mmetsp:Transcript_2398/g.4976  ORF Transcript_2398/g.4976 Transcript_2398/m.4976 type:complete len:149 (+) Transcript_2398:97-543(+)
MKFYPPAAVGVVVLTQMALFYFNAGGTSLALPSFLVWVGLVLLLLCGIAFFHATRCFAVHDTTIFPDGRPSALIRKGPFLLSRNPIYLILAVAMTGTALISQCALSFLLPPAFVVWVDRRWIVIEEENLKKEFGKEYEDYCKKVRRWI